MYIRVKDSNGHEFDVEEGSRLLAKGLVKRVDGVEPSTLPRPAKYATAGAPAAKRTSSKSTPKARTKATPKRGRTPRTAAAPAAAAPEAPAARPDQSASVPTPDATEKETIR